jgi:hypothetical protein
MSPHVLPARSTHTNTHTERKLITKIEKRNVEGDDVTRRKALPSSPSERFFSNLQIQNGKLQCH